MELVLYVSVANSGYSVGDEILVAKNNINGANMRAPAVTVDATNIYIRYASANPLWQITNKSTGGFVDITASNFRLIVRAIA